MENQAKTNLDDFNFWVADMDDALERFFKLLPGSIRSKLDSSPGSLDTLESWILNRYHSKDVMLRPDESRIVDGIARYIGETFRTNVGGHWSINLENPKAAFFGIPVLVGYRTPICPLALATASADRRTGRVIRTVLENNLKKSVK